MKNRTQKEWLKAFDDINEEIRLWQALSDLLTWVAMTASNDDTVKRNFPSAIVLLSNGVESVSDRHATLLQEFQKQRSGGENILGTNYISETCKERRKRRKGEDDRFGNSTQAGTYRRIGKTLGSLCLTTQGFSLL